MLVSARAPLVAFNLELAPPAHLGTAREIANTALFLASDEASYFTGEILHPDGGYFTD